MPTSSSTKASLRGCGVLKVPKLKGFEVYGFGLGELRIALIVFVRA